MRSPTRRFILSAPAVTLAAPAMLGACATSTPVASASATPTGLHFSSHQYATRDGQDLHLNILFDPSVPLPGKRPVILFVFGGGWEGGDRGDATSAEMFKDVLALGYAVVAIDYRLGVKIAKDRGEMTEANGTDIYLRAITWTVEDIYDATSFIVRRAAEWELDPGHVVLVGGSSGATSSLIAEYNCANATDLAKRGLPSGFRYAGVISMAGAFWLPAGTPLVFASKPAPILFFHGGKDWLVTYDENQQSFAGYGPTYYMRQFPGTDYPKWFYDYPDGDHIIAALPLMTRQLEIRAFLERFVRDRQALSIHTVERSEFPSSFEGVIMKAQSEQ